MPLIPRVRRGACGRQFRRRLQAADLGQGHCPAGRVGPKGAAYGAIAQDCLRSASCANWYRAKAQDLRHETVCGAGRARGPVAAHSTGSLAITAGVFATTTAGSLGVITAASTCEFAGATANAAQR